MTPVRKCACGRRNLPPRRRKCDLCLKQSRKRSNRYAHVQKNYDLSPAEYATLIHGAEGVCMGCGRSRKYNLHVDHDHKVERENGTRYSIRGLLCASCNAVLRKASDNPDTLRDLALYLDAWPSLALIGGVQGWTRR